ncbi:RNA-directed DNA polymerase, eukaryota, reverse transcriptase zinc-binding domain protein, partial [Tanacetum coccineum]
MGIYTSRRCACNQPTHVIPNRPISDCGLLIPDNGRYDPPGLRFRWAWNRDLRMRKLIMDSSPLSYANATRWNKLVPIKVNIASWRIKNRRIPTRVNLDSRGIDLHSTRCPICDDDLEMEDHILVKCDVALNIWRE